MRQLDLTERLLRLRGVPVFRSMSATELAPLAETMRAATFQRGEVLLHEDEPPRSFHMLLTGAVTMHRRGRKLRTISAPGGVGFLSLLARTGGGTEAVADSFTETFEVRADALEEMFEDHFPVLLGTMKWISEQLVAENIEQRTAPVYVPPEDGFDHLIGNNELGIVERIFLLRRTLGFKQTNVNSTARLARRMKEVRVPAGEKIWQRGEDADYSIFIIKGRMQTSWENGYREGVVQQLGPGYIVGGTESIAGVPRWNDLVTLDPAIYLRGSREGLIDMFEDDIEVALKFMSMMANFLLLSWDQKAEAAAKEREVDRARGRVAAPP